MTRIVPISGSAFPHQASRPRKNNPAEDNPRVEETRAVTTTSSATTSRRISARPGPTAPFLAQYVDQHFPWPRNQFARVQARQDAARAYADTNARDDTVKSPTKSDRNA